LAIHLIRVPAEDNSASSGWAIITRTFFAGECEISLTIVCPFLLGYLVISFVASNVMTIEIGLSIRAILDAGCLMLDKHIYKFSV